jgi:hypothetical protein
MILSAHLEIGSLKHSRGASVLFQTQGELSIFSLLTAYSDEVSCMVQKLAYKRKLDKRGRKVKLKKVEVSNELVKASILRTFLTFDKPKNATVLIG